MKGKFITFEGGEGAGKSTQVKLLTEKLVNLGLKVHATREPGGEEIGEKIRKILKNSEKIDNICETLLLFAARRNHFVQLISPLINKGYWVICDRFYDSSLVYQGLLNEVPIEYVMKLKQITVGDFEPDLTVILDVSSDISLQRIMKRDLIPDEYDLMNQQERDLIRSGFKKIAEIFSFRSVLINAEGLEKSVFSKIWKAVEERGIFNERLM